MLLDDFLSNDAFVMTNKKLIKSLWIEKAVFLQELVSQRKRFKHLEFYITQEEIRNELWISESTQNRYSMCLQKIWLIKVEKKWLPARNRYTINDEAILLLINQSCQNDSTSPVKLTEPVSSEWQDYSINNDNKNVIVKNNFSSNEEKCVDTQKENLWWIDTIETQQTEKEASWQNQKNIRECITEEWKAYNEIIERWVTFEDVLNAYPKTRQWFDIEKCKDEYQKLLEKWYSPNKIFEVAFLEKLRLRVKSALWKDDYRYIIKFDKFLKTYYEIDDDWIDLYIDEIVQLYENTKENHKYKESIISILRDIYWFERIKPFYKMHKKWWITLVVDWKVLNQ